jgi:hypothetical protein
MLAELTGHSKCHCYMFPTIIARDLLYPMFTYFFALQLNGKTLSHSVMSFLKFCAFIITHLLFTVFI